MAKDRAEWPNVPAERGGGGGDRGGGDRGGPRPPSAEDTASHVTILAGQAALTSDRAGGHPARCRLSRSVPPPPPGRWEVRCLLGARTRPDGSPAPPRGALSAAHRLLTRR